MPEEPLNQLRFTAQAKVVSFLEQQPGAATLSTVELYRLACEKFIA